MQSEQELCSDLKSERNGEKEGGKLGMDFTDPQSCSEWRGLL